jgi:hypothetical protein
VPPRLCAGLAQRLDLTGQHAFEEADVGVGGIEAAAAEGLVQDGAHGKLVGEFVHTVAGGLLGRHKGQLALDGAGGGLAHPGRSFGNAKVHDLGGPGQAHHDVVRADVAVDNVQRLPCGIAEVVGVAQAPGNALANGAHLCGTQRPAGVLTAFEQGVQVHTLYVLHGNVVRSGDAAKVVNINYIGVGKARIQHGFINKHLNEDRIVAQMRQDLFDHHRLLKPRLAAQGGQKKLRHATDSEPAGEGVASKNLTAECFHACLQIADEQQDV